MPKRTFNMRVGTSSVQVLDALPKRKSYSIVNNGSVTVYLGADQGLTVDSGEPLPAGAMVADDTDTEDVWAVAPVANQDIRVTEIIKGE